MVTLLRSCRIRFLTPPESAKLYYFSHTVLAFIQRSPMNTEVCNPRTHSVELTKMRRKKKWILGDINDLLNQASFEATALDKPVVCIIKPVF